MTIPSYTAPTRSIGQTGLTTDLSAAYKQIAALTSVLTNGTTTSTALVDQATTIWDYSLGNVATWTTNGNRTLQINNLPSGVCSGLLVFIQNSTGGYTPTLGGLNATNFAISQAANTVTLLDFTKIGNNIYWNSTPFGAISPTPVPGATTEAQANAAGQNYISRLNTKGANLTTAQQNGIAQFVTDIFSAGIYDKLNEFWLFKGGNANTNALSFKATGDLTFVGSWTHSATGGTPDGTTGYAKTGIIPSAALTLNSAGMSFYSRTQTQDSGDVLSAIVDANSGMRMVIRDQATDRLFSEIGSATQRIDLSSGGVNSKGFFTSVRSSATQFAVYRNGVSLGSNSATNTGSLPNLEMYIGALNKSGVPTNFADNECAGAFVHGGLSDTEVSSLYNAIQKLNTVFGVNV